MDGIADAVDRLRQPEHTGTNRCTPCTVGNLLIAAAIGGVLAVLVPWVGVVAFVVFAGIIYLRGYLVPGTPTLTKRYLPASVLRLFGKELPVERSLDGRQVSASPEDHDAERAGTVEALVAAGVVHRVGTDDIDLTPAFREEWRERIHAHSEQTPGKADVRAMFGASEISRHGDQSFVVDGTTSVRWRSAAALLADVTAVSLLEARLDGWTAFDVGRQRSVLSSLRLCLERCPSCDGPLDVTEDRADHCCRKPRRVIDAVCRDCGAPIADAAVVDDGDESVRLRLVES
jgi:hypothetical protein